LEGGRKGGETRDSGTYGRGGAQAKGEGGKTSPEKEGIEDKKRGGNLETTKLRVGKIYNQRPRFAILHERFRELNK